MLSPERYDVANSANASIGAVLLHPHPSYGGNRRNVVVESLFDALPAAGVATVRFDRGRRRVAGAR